MATFGRTHWHRIPDIMEAKKATEALKVPGQEMFVLGYTMFKGCTHMANIRIYRASTTYILVWTPKLRMVNLFRSSTTFGVSASSDKSKLSNLACRANNFEALWQITKGITGYYRYIIIRAITLSVTSRSATECAANHPQPPQLAYIKITSMYIDRTYKCNDQLL